MKRIITQEQMEGIQNAILQANVPSQIYVGIVQLFAQLPEAPEAPKE